MDKFLQKNEIFTTFSYTYLSPHFIMLKFYLRERTFNRNPSTTEFFCQNRSRGLPCRYCIASESMHI